MISITSEFIDAAAPNAEAARNGRGLVLKKKFLALHRSPDETLWFGRCAGSGKTPYLCSADFADPEKPVYRCSCPSRQFPCKHSLGLLHAIAEGRTFTTAEPPEELTSKREKAAADKPVKVDKKALAKKIQAQLAGLDLLETLTRDVVRLGVGAMNVKTARDLEERAKRLGDAYLPGARTALREFAGPFAAAGRGADREALYGEAVDRLCRLHALVRRGRAYLKARLDDPELAPETTTGIAAWLGHAWQLRELKDAGLVVEDAELIQLAFFPHDDPARKEYVDEGVWMDLKDGRIGVTRNYRPYKAARHVKEEDSFSGVALVKELCVYPGGLNPRIRWDGATARPIEPGDLARVRGHGRSAFAAAVKEVKSVLKDPLEDGGPVLALNYRRVGAVGEALVVEDQAGDRLVVTDAGPPDEPPTGHLLSLLPGDMLRDQTLIARFRHDLEDRSLRVKPLAIVTEAEVVRLI